MAGRTRGDRYRNRLLELREEAMSALPVLASGLWPDTPPEMLEEAQTAVARAECRSEIDSALRGWENGLVRRLEEGAEDLVGTVVREFGIPQRQIRAEGLEIGEP